LANHYAATDRSRGVRRNVILYEASSDGIAPGGIEYGPEKQHIDPVNEKRQTVPDELRQQHSRERGDRNCEQECDVYPGEVPVAAGEVVELCLLADPKDAERQEAH